MKTRVQIAVVGAGPAGARAAELLSGLGAEVVLLDPKVPWEKPCGGGLTPAAFESIPELAELLPLVREVTEARFETGADQGFTVPLDEPLRILPRATLSRWQLERAVARGAVHLPERVRELRRGRNYWRLDTDGGTLLADHVVGADGAASLVRRSVAPKFRVELAPTRVAFVPGSGPTPQTIVLRFFPRVAGYSWDFPRPGHRSFGVGVKSGFWGRVPMDRKVDELRSSRDGCVCQKAPRAGAVIGTAQLGHGDFGCVAGRRFALLGDAAGFADPATGEGIRNAMRSAELLAAAWAEDGTFRGYPARAREAFEREFRTGRRARRMVFDSNAGVRLIRAGTRSDAAYALLGALANAANSHDRSLVRLVLRWTRFRQRVRVDPELAGRTVRPPFECPCGCLGGARREQCVGNRSTAGHAAA